MIQNFITDNISSPGRIIETGTAFVNASARFGAEQAVQGLEDRFYKFYAGTGVVGSWYSFSTTIQDPLKRGHMLLSWDMSISGDGDFGILHPIIYDVEDPSTPVAGTSSYLIGVADTERRIHIPHYVGGVHGGDTYMSAKGFMRVNTQQDSTDPADDERFFVCGFLGRAATATGYALSCNIDVRLHDADLATFNPKK